MEGGRGQQLDLMKERSQDKDNSVNLMTWRSQD
jgi:hypothetical protein